MNITDETLSAFLDAELAPDEMETVRARIADDETLANRLAELASAETLVRETYSAIDETPMPAAITEAIANAARQTAEAPTQTKARVLRFPTFGRQHLAMAASIAFAVGFGLSHLLDTQQAGTSASWHTVAQALETTPSGSTLALGKSTAVTPRVTFTNAQGLVCRQYQVETAHNNTQAVACRGANEWHKVAAMTTEAAEPGTQYQTASGTNPINLVVDQMAVGPFLNQTQEADAIANQWQLAQ
ncbi:hypothetical protein L1F30_04180 [Simiduia sp. 21SJ11W-1]|uniref:anti-sigma factor family protein n=1 Tax=Simiduia sp. 21SJ11W-1 TaxID=2909669 RepID=UPI0020A198A6|nr:hypothetical protein [Simiduia sp. 21SJ11W-1]UTA48746.1 hypothetical protein L1F30_04180 [Simiduia sp. 21SJ11W-1]